MLPSEITGPGPHAGGGALRPGATDAARARLTATPDDIRRLARTIATHQDGRGGGDGTRVCAQQWEITRNLGIDWHTMTAAVHTARAEFGITPRPYGPYDR